MNIPSLIFSILFILFILFIIHAHIKPTYGVSLYVFMKEYITCVIRGK